jgi:hypothetical protein
MIGTRRWRTSEVLRISSATLKRELGPERWRSTNQVHVEADGYEADVRVIEAPCPTTHGGRRRFLECPRCGSVRATVLGVVPGVGWSCRACGRWRGRTRRPRRCHSAVSILCALPSSGAVPAVPATTRRAH